jgi:signal transduction histidine kinase
MLRGLEWRWTVRLALAVFVTAHVAGAIVVLRSEQGLGAAADQRAAAVARGVARRCRAQIVAGGPAELARCIRPIWEEPDIGRVAIEGVAGEVIAEHRFAAPAPARTVRYAVPGDGGAVGALVVVEVAQRAVDRATARARRDGLGAAAAFGVVGILLAWIATRRIARPLRALAVAETRIAAGDRSARVPTEGAPELADLANAFHTMVDAVRVRDEALEKRAAELQASLDRIRGLEAEKRALTAMIVHDLRSPVSSALAALLALDARALSAQDASLLAAAAERLEGALGLAGDLLEVARLESDAPALERSRVDLGALCRTLAAAPWPVPGGERAIVVTDLPADGPWVEGDARLLERAVSNLLSNAARHAGAAGPVLLRAWPTADGGARIEVEDHGSGVPEEERTRIFAPFARGTSARGPGAGLGLALCARVAAAHGGRIGVEDASTGTGARFVFELRASGAGQAAS